MKRSASLLFRWGYSLLILSCCSYLLGQAVHRTDWYKNKLYQRLVSAEADQVREVALQLARLGAQEELLGALKLESGEARTAARTALEFIWSNAAGEEARAIATKAVHAVEEDELDEALELLDDLIERFPQFAEAWNRRASVYWEMGDYERSMQDCRRALALNPNLYGAWQGVGICQLELGDIAGACESLRRVLEIVPFDVSTRRSLRRCEELLRVYPHPLESSSQGLLI